MTALTAALEVLQTDPLAQAAAMVVALLICLVALAMRAAGRAARTADTLAQDLGALAGALDTLSRGQERLSGGLNHLSQAQSASQMRVADALDRRLADMGQGLSAAATGTAQSLGALEARLTTIDRAQETIAALSSDVLSLQDILSNKQTRGAFGEIQLHEIVSNALPADAFRWQATLSTGVRADCLILLPDPPGPVAIDAKFPLEAYEALLAADRGPERERAARAFRTALRGHIKAISQKYILPGETADGALMFLPSEAVYATLHADFGDVVREGFAARVWTVSPTTCMATLTTLSSVLKDVRLREQAGAIRAELGHLEADLARLGDRVTRLDRHFGLAASALEEVKASSARTRARAQRLEALEFDKDLPQAAE